MTNTIISGIKTAMQFAVAAGLAWLGGKLGIDLSGFNDGLVLFLTAVGTGVVAWLTNLLGKKYPIVAKIMSLGTASSEPMYQKAPLSQVT